MRDIADIAALVAGRTGMMLLLAALEQQDLPDAWIGAGLIRNAVWDALGGVESALAGDVDVIYFDGADIRQPRDAMIEENLRRKLPGALWSVKNQARMHRRNGDRPYRDSADAIAHWPETATAIAVRSIAGKIDVLAPHGVTDLLGFVVRPTPAFAVKREQFFARVQKKSWQTRWPRLRIVAPD